MSSGYGCGGGAGNQKPDMAAPFTDPSVHPDRDDLDGAFVTTLPTQQTRDNSLHLGSFLSLMLVAEWPRIVAITTLCG